MMPLYVFGAVAGVVFIVLTVCALCCVWDGCTDPGCGCGR